MSRRPRIGRRPPRYGDSLRASVLEARRRWGRSATVGRVAAERVFVVASRDASGLPVLRGRGGTLREMWADADKFGVPRGGVWTRIVFLRDRAFDAPCVEHLDCEPVLRCVCDDREALPDGNGSQIRHSCGIPGGLAEGLAEMLPGVALAGDEGDFEVTVRFRPRAGRRT